MSKELIQMKGTGMGTAIFHKMFFIGVLAFAFAMAGAAYEKKVWRDANGRLQCTGR